MTFTGNDLVITGTVISHRKNTQGDMVFSRFANREPGRPLYYLTQVVKTLQEDRAYGGADVGSDHWEAES